MWYLLEALLPRATAAAPALVARAAWWCLCRALVRKPTGLTEPAREEVPPAPHPLGFAEAEVRDLLARLNGIVRDPNREDNDAAAV